MPELRADVLPNDLALTRAPLGWSVLIPEGTFLARLF